MKYSLKNIFQDDLVTEGMVPQGAADERPLHGAPVYYFPTGRSLPKHLQDRGGMSSARKWNKNGGLLDVEELEDKQEKKRRWYKKDKKNEEVESSETLVVETALAKDEDILQHLKRRGVDPERTKVITDLASNMAVFLLYNLSGKMVGYQQYNPAGSKKEHDPDLSKYWTWISQEGEINKRKAMAVWGLESVDDRPFVFVTEGIFDAVKLQNEGLPAVAVMMNDPKLLKAWFVTMQKYVIVVADNDQAGQKLRKIGTTAISTPSPYKDLGEMPQDEVRAWLESQLPSFVFESTAKGLWYMLKEYYPHDPAIDNNVGDSGVEGDFYSMTQNYYHGSNKEFAPGDYIKPPSETGEMSEKGRKKNLDKVFFTLDKGSANIYAGRAVQSFGTGSPNVYRVQPIGDVEWLNKQKGTTVLMAPLAKVIDKVQ